MVEWQHIMANFNLVIGGIGFAIYFLWAIKWKRRGVTGLFILNLLAAIGLAAFSVIFAIIVVIPEKVVVLGPGGLRYVLPFAIGVPIVARLIEYRRDHQREKYARDVVDQLRGEVDGVA